MSRIFILALIATVARTPVSADSPVPNCASALCRAVVSGSVSSMRWPVFLDYRTRVEKFYEPTDYTFAWIRSNTATDQAKAIIEVFNGADAKGLNAEDYDGSRWADRLARLQPGDTPALDSAAAEFDLALTVSVMRYVIDLHFGRANPGIFRARSDMERFDVAGFVRQHLVDSSDVQAALEGIEPPYEGYRRTERALQQYIALARENQGSLFPATRKPVEPGSSYDGATHLANLLRRLGDLPVDVTIPVDSDLYDGALVDAVKRFQMRHGLDPDGRLGKATVAQLNTPLSRRVRQLQLTLERWRWVPYGFPRPPIVINIPEFVLRAVNDSYETDLEMKVVVGKAYRHQTPMFAAEMNRVVFRPYWNVPLSIQRAELVPKLDRDPAYLAKNHYEVVTPQNTVVTNGIVDQATLEQLRSGKLHIRQIPGPENALGLVAFRFPNEYDVYLHATPATELFAKSRRDFSHGCIRAEKPQQLAEWVLRNQPAWTPERIADTMNGPETVQVKLDQPIPILIVYATAVALENGEVRFFDDIYGQDAELAALLKKGYTRPTEKPTSAGRDPRPRE